MKLNDLKGSLIIFGAGLVAEVAYRACQSKGIKVECFCDNNLEKTKGELCGLRIIHVPRLKEMYPDAIFVISAADIMDVVSQLEKLGYERWQGATGLLRDFNIHEHKFSANPDFVEYAVSTALLCQDSYLDPQKLFIRSVDLIITERCSLRCRDCSNLMRYYQDPADCDMKDLMVQMDRFLAIVDQVNEIRVIGGEPFMNPDAHKIIRRLAAEPKIKKVVIYTNGTIPPRTDQIEDLAHEKVLFIITDYGDLSANLSKMTTILKEHGITHHVVPCGGWTDCAHIGPHDRGIVGNTEIFSQCCAKNTITLTDGKLYRCPFCANAYRLFAIPKSEGDYVDIFEDIGTEKLKKKMKMFLTERKYLDCCDFCNGRSFSDPHIVPAIQVEKSREYERYD